MAAWPRSSLPTLGPTAAELAAFRAKTRPVYDKWVGEIGGEFRGLRFRRAAARAHDQQYNEQEAAGE